MELDPTKFDKLLGPGGPVSQCFGYRRATACPCVNPASGAAKPNCPLCAGKRVFWADEITDGCDAGMSVPTQSKAFAQFGQWEPGDAVLSVPQSSGLYAMRQFDRVRCLSAFTPFSTVNIHGENDRLFGTVKEISRVFWLDTDGQTIVEGAVPDMDDAGFLTWTTGEPPDETPYTIEGVKFLEFYLYLATPSFRNAGARGLPLRVPVRRFDLFGR